MTTSSVQESARDGLTYVTSTPPRNVNVTVPSSLKSFDYEVLTLIVLHLTNKPCDDALLDFLNLCFHLVEIEAFPTANRFTKGHRIRLDVSSSNFPHFDVNPNTDEPEGYGFTPRRARNRVYMDAQRPSRLLLPIVTR